MENNESNMKPQQTGGLKLMTVFVVVLALHVVVIGGMTTYYLLKGGSADADLLTDKNHKGLKANADGTLVADGQLPDATDKNSAASVSTPAPDTSATAATTPSVSTPAPDETVSSDATPAPLTPATPPITPETIPATVVATPVPTTVAIATTSTPSAPAPMTTPIQTVPVVTPPPAPASITPEMAQSTPVTGGTPYVVVSHDSLAKIAHKNHITVANLMAANSLTSDKLSIGQKLVIPVKAPAATTTVATTDATPALTPTTVKKAKSIATIKPATTPTKLDAGHHLYTIVKGDTLTKIAHKFKTTPNALMMANNITDPTKLSIGKKLTIPAKEAHTANTSAPVPATVQPAQVEPRMKSAAQLANVTQ